MQVIPRDVFMDSTALLRAGDIVGFVTQRANLDYFHIGFVAFDDDGRFMLRHAAKSRIACSTSAWTASSQMNHVHYVTLLRPQEVAVV